MKLLSLKKVLNKSNCDKLKTSFKNFSFTRIQFVEENKFKYGIVVVDKNEINKSTEFNTFRENYPIEIDELKNGDITSILKPITSDIASKDVYYQKVFIVNLNSDNHKMSKTIKSLVNKLMSLNAFSVNIIFSSQVNQLYQRSFIINQIINSNYITHLSNHTNYSRPNFKQENKPSVIQELNIFKDEMFKTLNKDSELLKLTYLAEAKNYTKDIANTRGNTGNCNYMEQESLKVLKEVQDDIMKLKNENPDNLKIEASVEIIKGNKLLDERMNLFHAVGSSAQTEPRLIILKYMGNQVSDEISHCILGKGLTFDTGGLNLKPTGHIEDMFLDKHGACNALAIFKYLAKLDVKLNVVCALAVAENSIDSKSYKPSDIITSRKGYTVEIGNTDAEGRLCLVDAISYIQDKYKPNVLIDLATLTGACCVALVRLIFNQ